MDCSIPTTTYTIEYLTLTMVVVHCINKTTGIYTGVKEAKRGNSYTCLVCDEPVLIREGERNTKHFAHYPHSCSSCVEESHSSSSSYGETPDQHEARLMLKNCVDMKRDLTLRSLCLGVHCTETQDIDYKTLSDITLTIKPTDDPRSIQVHTHSILQNYTYEGPLVFQCSPIWKCIACSEFEKEEAARFEANRKEALRQAKIEENTFRFGKHNGRTFDYVLDNDPHYCKWLLDTEPRTTQYYVAQQRMRVYIREYLAKQKKLSHRNTK